MKYFQRMPIEQFVRLIITEDRETAKMTDTWNIERDEIVKIIVQHFRELGIFQVDPMAHAELIYKNIHNQILYSPELRQRLAKVQEEIERTKARQSRHAV